MKKNNKLVYGFASIAATALMALAPAAGVFAATSAETQTKPLTSTAEVEVVEGGDPTNPNPKGPDDLTEPDLPDTGTDKTGEDLLQLVAVPNLHFAKDSSGTAVKAGNLQIADQTGLVVDSGTVKTPADGNEQKHLTVSDYRGTLAGWKLDADLSDFTLMGDDTVKLSGTLHLKNEDPSTSTDQFIGAHDTNFQSYKDLSAKGVDLATGSNDIPVMTAGTGEGYGMTIANMSASTLDLNKNEKATKGTYEATMTWTLGNTPSGYAAGEGTETSAPTTGD